MVRFGLRNWAAVCAVGVFLVAWQLPGHAVPLDKDGDIKLGVRTYVNARIGTENTHQGVPISDRDTTISGSGTFPKSNAGHLRQNRYFIEAEFKHDLNRLLKAGIGPLSLLNDLPVKIDSLSYGLTFRGEADMLYDWGPREYSTAQEFKALAAADPPNPNVGGEVWLAHGAPLYGQAVQDPYRERRRLRKLGVHRERLFQSYVDVRSGDLFLRIGRQILSWGETDGFRLLDNINPLDSSFGGFLVPLDERRMPLDMLRAQYYIGEVGPFSEMFFEAYGAIDNTVGYYPGTPAGSPWAGPGLGASTNDSTSYRIRPARNFKNTRGGGRLVFSAFDATFSIAHYYTYFDLPGLRVQTRPELSALNPDRGNAVPFIVGFNEGRPCGVIDPATGLPTSEPDFNNMNCGAPTHVYQTAPKVQVSGATTTFAIPSIYSVLRSEIAYFKGEPAYTQGHLDPFTFNLEQFTRRRWGQALSSPGRQLRDSINFVVGLDRNQWIRWLNPHQTFFISTQFFYKHLRHAGGSQIWLDSNGNGIRGDAVDANGLPCKPGTKGCVEDRLNPDREVLPAYLSMKSFDLNGSEFKNLQPVFVTQPKDAFLQTFFIGTSMRSGTINPGLVVFYDWGGAFVYQPTVTFLRDPFRFTVDYSILDAHTYKAGSGVSLGKDRDNIQFRFEYVI